MRFTDTSLGIIETIFKPPRWNCVKHHEIIYQHISNLAVINEDLHKAAARALWESSS